MVEYQSPQLDRVFHALSDPTRRAILGQLTSRPRMVTEISAPFAMSLAAVSKHLKALERAGIIQREIHGRRHLCSLRPEALAEASDWLEYFRRFWEERLEALDQLLSAGNQNEQSTFPQGSDDDPTA